MKELNLIKKNYLILSVDVINSTSNKYIHGILFMDLLKNFCLTFPIIYGGKLLKYDPEIQIPEVLKYLGDEIIFIQLIENNKKVEVYINTFIEAIKEYNNKPVLKLKGCAWIADEQKNIVLNTIFNANKKNIQDDYKKKYFDIIGYQMDIGFRISKFATLSNFIISIEIAIILLENKSSWIDKVIMYYTEKQILKGALNNIPYPIISIGVDDDIINMERKLLQMKTEPCCKKTLLAYCKKIYPEFDELISCESLINI